MELKIHKMLHLQILKDEEYNNQIFNEYPHFEPILSFFVYLKDQ